MEIDNVSCMKIDAGNLCFLRSQAEPGNYRRERKNSYGDGAKFSVGTLFVELPVLPDPKPTLQLQQ